MRRLTLADVERIRRTPGRSLLLFITDRCPVGCAHCSVDSRRDSPRIRDFELFESLVEQICNQPRLTTVGVSGGEPFVERRGLTLATERLAAASKDLVLYTSGVWAQAETPRWIQRVLARASCVYLSTDAFHAAAIDDQRFIRAAQLIAAQGAWIIVQVLRMPEMVAKAEGLLEKAFGKNYEEWAELSLTTPLPYGRGEAVFHHRGGQPGSSFGVCPALASPVVRYDGRVSACCNEQVILGLGPKQLHRRCSSAPAMTEALHAYDRDPLLQVIGRVGAGALTTHPRFAHLSGRPFASICELCWEALDQASAVDDTDRLLAAMRLLRPKAAE